MSVIVGCVIWILYSIAAGKKDGIELVINIVIQLTDNSYKYCDILSWTIIILERYKLGIIKANTTN